MKKGRNMKTVFFVSENGIDNLLDGVFYSIKDAQTEINSFFEGDRHSLSVVEIPEYEYIGKLSIDLLFCSDKAVEIEKAINKYDGEEKVNWYIQIGLADENWVGRLYAEHFEFALLVGGFACDEDFEVVELLPFTVFLEKRQLELEEIKNDSKVTLKAWLTPNTDKLTKDL